MKEKSNNWGGARKGAGRKPNADKGKYYGFYATHEVQAIMESIEDSKTEFINKCIIFYARNYHNV